MPGISLRSGIGLVTAVAGLVLCGLGLLGSGADAIGASADKRFQCSYRSNKPVEVGKRIDAKGRLKCIGADVQRQVLRTCLMQETGSRFTLVKCVTHSLNRGGLVTGTAARLCPRGEEVAFKTRIHVRIRLAGGSVQKASADSSKVPLERNCVG